MNEDDTKLNEFKKELKALLLKYDATIELNADDGSDWYGINGPRMEVEFGNSNKWELLTSGLGIWEGDL